MFDINHIRRSIGSWVSQNQRTALAGITLVVFYGFFHFGIDAYSWIVTWQIGTIILLLVLLASLFDTRIKTIVAKNGDDSGEPEPSEMEDALRKNGRDIEIIRELSDQFYVKSRGSTEKDFTLFLSKIISIIKKTFAAKTAAFFLLNQHKNNLTLKCIVSDYKHKDPGTEFDSGASVAGRILETGRPILTTQIENAADFLLYYDNPDDAAAAIAVPISVENEIIGILIIDSAEKNAFHEDDIQLVETYGGVIAEIIVNYNNLFEFENSARLFSSFYEVSRGLNSNLKFEEILDLLFDIVKQIFHYDRITIARYMIEENSAEIIRVEGQIDEFPEGKKFPLDEGLNGWVIRKRKPLRVSDMEKGDYFMPRYNKLEKTNFDLRSFLACPISYHDFTFGAISVESREHNVYKERHERILVMLANNFGVALERSHVLEKLESLATTDGLTNLYNYRSFAQRLNEEIERSMRYNLRFSLLMLDLDHFKKVNDTYGHLAGDIVLKKVAECIRQSTRGIDFIARYGGEEFTVILIEANLEDSLITAERIRKNIETAEISYNNETINTTISIGAVEFTQEPKDSQELIDLADKALYRAKESGRNRIIAYRKEEAELYLNKD